MIRALVRACLQARHLVVLAAIGLLIAGFFAARGASVDTFPEFAPPAVEIQTEAPGLSSLDVENLVTTPLESSLSGISFVQTIRSQSVLGLSSVVVLFEQGTDVFVARQLVQERLARAIPLLPVAARPPAIMPPISSTGRVMMIGLSSRTLSGLEITDLERWSLRPRLLAVPGVARVAVWGARERQYDVRLDPARVEAAGVTIADVVSAVQGATVPVAGGYMDGPQQRMAVRLASPVSDAASLRRLAVATRGGAVLHLDDVASVIETHPVPIGDAVVGEGPAVLLVLDKQPWGNTLEITRRVDEVLAQMAPALPGVQINAHVFRPATFVEQAIANLQHAMWVGCAFVVLVLLLMLWNWRTALISAIAIPLSVSAALLVLRSTGATLNTMVLAGLVIALGEVVDDAIIDVENILRRLQENRLRENPRAALRVALDASLEVRSAVVYATIIVVLVFLPVVFLEGVSGAFFRPLALAYGLCVLMSMLVALIVTPALSLILLPKSLSATRHSPILTFLARNYARILPRLLAHPRMIMGSGVIVVAIAVGGFLRLGDSFLPEFRENDFLSHWVAQPGASLTALRRTTVSVSRALRAIPGVTSVGAHLGRAEGGEEIAGPNFGELWVHVDPSSDHERIVADIERTLARYPGIQHDVETYLRERIEEVLSGSHGSIVIRISGTELASLRQGADAIAARLHAIAGVRDVQVEHQTLVPELRVTQRPEAAALGFLTADIRRATALWVRGERVGEVIRDSRSIAVVVRGMDSFREDPITLGETLVTSASGARARLRDVAQLSVEPTPNEVPHEDGLRCINISVGVAGDLGDVARAVERAVRATPLAAGHHADVLGEWRERADAQARLVWLSTISLVLILLVLYVDLKSARRTALVAASLPFALAGGVAGAWLAGGLLSLGSLVGLVTVLGIASRNGILLVSHYRHLEENSSLSPLDVVTTGSVERIGPIMMTALATGLALVPLVVAGQQAGHEIEHPMAVVILGGLVSSTLLNLLVLPALYHRFGTRRTSARQADLEVGADSSIDESR